MPDIRAKVSENWINALTSPPKGKGVVASASDGWIYFLSEELKVDRKVSIGPWAGAMTFTPDGKKLIAVMKDESKEDTQGRNVIFELEVMDTETCQIIQHIGRSIDSYIGEIACSHSGHLVAMSCAGPLRIFNVETGMETGTWDWSRDSHWPGGGLSFSADDRLLYCGGTILAVSKEGELDTRNIKKLVIDAGGTRIAPDEAHWFGISSWNPKFLGFGYKVAKLYKGDLPRGTIEATWTLKHPESDRWFAEIQASHDGQIMLAEYGGDVVIHNANDGGIADVLTGGLFLTAATYSDDERSVYAGDENGFLCRWRLPNPPR